jgi:catechol 2,3-dioxygenase-like lactoylglutathione lyase family enzyme
MDLNHLNLRVRDASACRDFYQKYFGFRLPDGFHIGFGLRDADAVTELHRALAAAVRTTAVEDFRPSEAYVTFRCWDPDGTEVEVFWEAP